MHLTLKREATQPAADNFLQQQARFDDFIDYYNHQRPLAAMSVGRNATTIGKLESSGGY